MIKKLKKRVKLLIKIPMFLLIALISAAFLYLNYTGIMSSANDTMNRFSVVSNDGEESGGEMTEREKTEPREAAPEKPKGDSDNDKTKDYGVLYEFEINDGSISSQTTDNKSAAETALKVAGGDEGSGVTNGFFYRVQRKGAQNYVVKLLRSDSLYQSFVLTNIVTLVIFLIGIITVVLISLFVSKIVLEPVEKNEQKQKAFISDTSHELKTPLAVIAANAEVLESEVGQNKWLGYIQRETAGMEQLVGSLLILSRAESDDNGTACADFDLSHRAEICAAAFEAHAYENGLSLHSEIEPGITFRGSEYDIDSIISPLLDNAIRHTPKNGNISLTVKRQKSAVVITVQNEGEPIPEEDTDKIFDRFYRVDKARSRSENRFGLGLPIVQALAQRYNGFVRVKCENGLTAFTVKLKDH